MTPLAHEIATFLTLSAAGAFLVWHFSGVGRPQGQPGCSRCDQRLAPAPVPARAVRSRQLRVLQ